MPYDNAMAESFFGTRKLELIPDKAFVSREAPRLAVFDYIEAFYNRTRMHSALGYQSPRLIRRPVQSPEVCALGPLSEEPGPLHSVPLS